MATWYDVKVTSGKNAKLADDAEGRGFAMGLEIGRRTDMGDGLTVTPAVGLTWSDVSLSFTEPPGMETGRGGSRVSIEDARSLVGRAGVRVEARTGRRSAAVRLGRGDARVLGREDGEG